MRIALVTDAWHPRVNGVVRTWTAMCHLLAEWGHEIRIISPEGSRTVPAPSEPERCLTPGRQLDRRAVRQWACGWDAIAQDLISALVPIDDPAPTPKQALGV